MEQPFTDILIRIRKGSRASYLVEAWLSDSSFYEGKARLTKPLRQQLLESDYEPVQYGERLFKTLFDGPIATAYDVATGLARQRSDGRLRIRLLLDESAPAELHALKWERMANLQGIPLAISDDTPFSRYTALAKAEPGPLDEPVVRLLFVVSAPSDLEAKGLAKIDVEKEIRRLLDALADVWHGERCQATILPGQTGLSPDLRADLEAAGCTIAGGNATLDNISERLRGQHVLHFLGHGQYKDGHGYLLLENEGGTLERVVDTDLAVRLGNTPVRLVFLAACESARRDADPAAGTPQGSSFQGLAGKLVQGGGIPAVVAMQEQLEIDAAYRLTGEFYRRLFLEHGAVDRALNEARALLYRQRQMDWGTPVLTMRLKTGQLATANPIWTALQAIREHRDYAIFRAGQYIPLALQAMLVNEGQDASQYERPEPQRIGTLDLMDAILSRLAANDPVSTDRASATPLVLVLGGPSTGKSTQMKRLGWETVQAGLRAPAEQFFLPLYLDLQNYRPGGSATTDALEGQILDRLRLFLPALAARSLDELSKQMPHVRLRLLFSAGDTLPEVGRDLVRLTVALALRDRRHHHQYVLATQPAALHWDDLEKVDQARRCVLAIQPLEQRRVRHALEAQGEPGQRLLNALYDTSLFDLASTPFFFVNMLTRARKGPAPASRAEVLQQPINEAIVQVPPEWGMRANASRTLFEMAFEMQRSDITVWPIEEAFRAMSSLRGERGYAVEELYESLVENELLVPLGEDALRFAYSSIQAYCCAQAILALPEPDKTLCEIVGSLGSPIRVRWWEETLVVTSGLLAADPRSDAQQTLRCLLESIIYGADLLEGTRVFLGARCLLECWSVLDAQANPKAKEELHQLVDHIVNALLWRSDSTTEPDLAQRLQATQLLAQLPMPEATIGLARKAYCKVRKNVADQWDYEFSSVRFAAAIALKRVAPDKAAVVLNEISPKLVELFEAWKEKDVNALIRHSNDSEDLGIQGLAALALGDLHGPLGSENRTDDAKRALDCLKEMFRSAETRQNVRWAVADALSLLDGARVTEEIVNPLLGELSSPGGTGLRNPAKIRKSLAYLIGLLRLRDERAHNFLVRECLGLEGKEGSKDWSTWATAITALGRIAAESDKKLLAEIAAGRAKGKELQEFFPQEAQRNWVRRQAINALANQGDLEVLCPEDRDRLAKEPALFRAYYQAIQDIYWRREAATRAAQGRIP
jgi:hypothetical protein